MSSTDSSAGAVLDWRAGEAWPHDVSMLNKAMTLVVRLAHLRCSGELLSWTDEQGRAAMRWSTDDVLTRASVVAQVAFDARPAPLRLSVPIEAIG